MNKILFLICVSLILLNCTNKAEVSINITPVDSLGWQGKSVYEIGQIFDITSNSHSIY